MNNEDSLLCPECDRPFDDYRSDFRGPAGYCARCDDWFWLPIDDTEAEKP